MAGRGKGSKGPIVINELLCFVTNKINILDPKFLVKICTDKYKPKEIEKAKKELFNLLTCDDDPTLFKKRNHSKVSDDKATKDMHDIYQLLQEKGTKEWPQFAALDLSKLPPIGFDCMDVSVLLTKMQEIYLEVEMFREALSIQCNISESMKISLTQMQERMTNMEAKCVEKNNTKETMKDKPTDKPTGSDNDDKPLTCTESGVRIENVVDPSADNSCEDDDNDDDEEVHDNDKDKSDGSDEIFSDTESNEFGDEMQLQMFECKECDYRFMTNDGLKAHIITHKKDQVPKIVCSKCNKSFANNEDLAKHMQTHSEENSFSCTECNYTCAVKEMLRSHMRMHFVDKPRKTPHNSTSNFRHRESTSGRNDSVSSGNAWDKFNRDEVARQYFIESLMNSDGFSAPFKNGKPIKLNDLHRQYNKEQHARPQRKSAIIGKSKGSSALSIKTRTYQAKVFASRYPPGANPGEVKHDLEQNLKHLTGTDHRVTVEPISTKYGSYASFKITCFCPHTAVFMNPDIWPEGCLVNWWREPRYKAINTN